MKPGWLARGLERVAFESKSWDKWRWERYNNAEVHREFGIPLSEELRQPVEIYMGKCNDGIMHAFQSLDDGAPAVTPLCESRVRFVDSGEEKDWVCDDCVHLFAKAFNIPVEEFTELLESQAD